MANFPQVKNNYIAITQLLTQARNLLITKLNNCYITNVNNYTILELIEAVGEIETPEYYNDNNIKPEDMPTMVWRPLLDYNESLFLRISYYMELLAYYLVNKGVPTYLVNQQTTLFGLINLIDEIYAKIPVTMTVQEPEEHYYFGEDIILNYEVIDYYGNEAVDGEITISLDGVLYDSIKMGEKLKFKPDAQSIKINNEYEPIICTITYNGSNDYKAYQPISKEIIVYPQKVNITISPINRNTMSKYYMDINSGYENDRWSIQVTTNITNTPFEIYIDDVLIDEYITHETTGKYLIWHTFDQVGEHTIRVVTTYDDIDYAINSEKTHTINTYYFPLHQITDTYIDYAGKDSYEYSIGIIDEETGEMQTADFNNQTISLFLNDNQIDDITIEAGMATAIIPLLGYGEHTLKWSFQNNTAITHITILSNFITPSQNIFFLADTPDIIYAPLNTEDYGENNWTPVQNKKVTGTITMILGETNNPIIDIEWYTNNQGILHKLKEYTDPGQYIIDITSASDSLTERLHYEYTLHAPFICTLISASNDHTIRQYRIDKYYAGNINISFDENIQYTCNEATPSNADIVNSYIVTIRAVDNIDFDGAEITMTISCNGYSENFTHILYCNTYKLLTPSMTFGQYQNIQIKCNDSTIDNITLSGDIDVESITKQNNIFICNIRPINMNGSISISPNPSDQSFNLTVAKGTLTPVIHIQKNNQEVTSCLMNEINSIDIFLEIEESLYDYITFTYKLDNNDINTDTITPSDNTSTIFSLPNNTTSGTHTITMIYSSGSNDKYNSFSVSKNLTISKLTSNHQITGQYSVYRR